MRKSIKIKFSKLFLLVLTTAFVFTSLKAQNDDLVVYDNYNSTVKNHKFRIRDSFSLFMTEFKGDIQVSDDDKMITGISPGGFLKIYKKTFGNKRGLEIKEIYGKLIFDYYSGNKKRPFEPEGKEWLSEILPEVIRTTGINAKQRVDRFYKKGGINAVLSEIRIIPNDAIKIKYYKPLLAKTSLSSNDLIKIAASIAKELSYDSSKSDLLNNLSSKFLQSENSSLAFFDIVKSMSYDTEKNKVLEKLEIEKLSDKQKSGYLGAVQSMSYDSEKAKALIDYNGSFHQDKNLSEQYFSTIKNMSYDSYRSKVLNDLLNKEKLDAFSFEQIILSLKSFSYDSEMLKVLLKVNKQFANYKNISNNYFRVYQSMSYDSYQKQGLNDFLDRNKLSDQQMIGLFEVLTHFSYDSYQREVLLQAIPKMTLNNQVVDAFFATVKSMSYDSEMERVIINLVENRNLTDYAVSSVLKASKLLSYDSSKVRVLKSVKKYVSNSPELKAEFKLAVKGINSDSEYRNLMDEMD